MVFVIVGREEIMYRRGDVLIVRFFMKDISDYWYGGFN